jgi:hypothetical protein
VSIQIVRSYGDHECSDLDATNGKRPRGKVDTSCNKSISQIATHMIKGERHQSRCRTHVNPVKLNISEGRPDKIAKTVNMIRSRNKLSYVMPQCIKLITTSSEKALGDDTTRTCIHES